MVDYDEVLWTELEFLRLHASILRTLSSTENVGGGRAEVKKKGAPPPLPHAADALDLRARIDALQRKALRMLHRAQLEARAGGGAGGPTRRTTRSPVVGGWRRRQGSRGRAGKRLWVTLSL